MFGTISDVRTMPHFTSMWYLEKMKGLPQKDSPSIFQAAIDYARSTRCGFVLKDSYLQWSTALSDCPDDDGKHHCHCNQGGY